MNLLRLKTLLLLSFFAGQILGQMPDTMSTDTFFKRQVADFTSTTPHALAHGYLGNFAVGGSGQNTTRLTDKKWDPDANISLTLGLGDPERLAGLELRWNLYGISNVEGKPNNLGEGTLDWQLNRMIFKHLWVAVGGYDLVGYRAGEPNTLASSYACATTFLMLRKDNRRAFSTIFLNAGIGNGRFRRDEDFTLKHSGPVGAFGSVGIAVLPGCNLVAEWTGYGPYLGGAFQPFRKWPVQIVVGADDLNNRQWRWVVAGTVGFHFKTNKKWRDSGRFRPYFWPSAPSPQSSRV